MLLNIQPTLLYLCGRWHMIQNTCLPPKTSFLASPLGILYRNYSSTLPSETQSWFLVETLSQSHYNASPKTRAVSPSSLSFGRVFRTPLPFTMDPAVYPAAPLKGLDVMMDHPFWFKCSWRPRHSPTFPTLNTNQQLFSPEYRRGVAICQAPWRGTTEKTTWPYKQSNKVNVFIFVEFQFYSMTWRNKMRSNNLIKINKAIKE